MEVQGIDETKDIITYTWQQYDAAGIYQGQWNNIETWGEQTNVLRTIHADNRSELNGKHYRVKADIQKEAYIPPSPPYITGSHPV